MVVENKSFTLAEYGIFGTDPPGKEECPLVPVHRRCTCTYYLTYDFLRLVRTIRHGENPEHSITLTEEEMCRSPICTGGHVLTACSWAARVVEYVHRESK